VENCGHCGFFVDDGGVVVLHGGSVSSSGRRDNAEYGIGSITSDQIGSPYFF